MRGQLSVEKNSAHTRRRGFHLVDDKPTPHGAVQGFAKYLSHLEKIPNWHSILLRKPIAWRLFHQLISASEKGLSGEYYRARRFAKDAPHPTVVELGPPPQNQQGEGRYTNGTTLVFYLSNSVKTAEIETRNEVESKPKAFILKYNLWLPQIRVVKLSLEMEERFPYLHYLLLDSEYLPEETTLFPFPYRPTQFVAYLCQLIGISAIEYPSVKSDWIQDKPAHNLAIFGNAINLSKKMTVGVPFEFGTAP